MPAIRNFVLTLTVCVLSTSIVSVAIAQQGDTAPQSSRRTAQAQRPAKRLPKPGVQSVLTDSVKENQSSRRTDDIAVTLSIGDAKTGVQLTVGDNLNPEKWEATQALNSSEPTGTVQNLTDQTASEGQDQIGESVVAPERLARLPLTAKAAEPKSLPIRLKDFTFSNPNSFLVRPVFVDPSKYLQEDQRAEQVKRKNPTHLPSATNSRVPTHRAMTRINAGGASNFQPLMIGSNLDDDDKYLPVSGVDQPIADNPFANIVQDDSFGLLTGDVMEPSESADATTYSSLTKQPVWEHVATYHAHRFRHRPLYFEEVNLERYGNQLPMQSFASAAHFFTSAVLLPYQIGATSPRCCISTLGHQRPGDCVPYQIHRMPRSWRGLIYQGLVVTAVSF